MLKAYRELEHEGLVRPKPGVGTFVTRTLADDDALAAHGPLRQDLREGLLRARAAGLDVDSIEALFQTTLRGVSDDEAGSAARSDHPGRATG